jgi:hypothetical protein
MKPRERIEVLLSLLGGHQRVTLPVSDVEAATRAPVLPLRADRRP